MTSFKTYAGRGPLRPLLRLLQDRTRPSEGTPANDGLEPLEVLSVEGGIMMGEIFDGILGSGVALTRKEIIT